MAKVILSEQNPLRGIRVYESSERCIKAITALRRLGVNSFTVTMDSYERPVLVYCVTQLQNHECIVNWQGKLLKPNGTSLLARAKELLV